MKRASRSRVLTLAGACLLATLAILAILAILVMLVLPALAQADDPLSEPPTAPTGLTGQVSHDRVSLSWNDPGDDSITGYQVLRRNRSVDGAGEFNVHVDDTGSASTSYVDTGLAALTRYVYRVKARNGAGLSPQSGYFDADTPEAPPEPPAAPTGLSGQVAHNQVTLSWDDPGDDTITGYQVLRRNRAVDGAGEFHVHVDDTGSDANEYVDADVEPETRYVYRIKARNAAGLSEQSGYLDADTQAEPPKSVPRQALAAPTGLLALPSHDRVSLSWEDPGDAAVTGYRILRGPDTDTLSAIVEDTNSAATSFTDNDVEPETVYVYAVQAINAGGVSELSNAVETTTLPPPPDAPIDLLTTASHNQVLLSWTAPDDHSITGYRILRGPDTDTLSAIVEDTNSAATSFTDNDVEPETVYVYAVRAIDAGGVSELSNAAETTTLPPPPDAPIDLLTTASHNQVLLSWTAPDDHSITGYRILRGPDTDTLSAIVEDTNSAATSFTDNDVEPETVYVYAVRAINKSGASEVSESKSVTTLWAPQKGNSGVCDRTDAVEEAIIAAVPDVTACADITAEHLAAIENLDLSRQSITSLQSGDFSGLTALQGLDLANNALTSLPAGVFNGLTMLENLERYANSLTSLPASVFDGLTALETLYLYRNSLTSLPAGVFDGLTALNVLAMSRNSLTSLPAGVFDELTKLTVLLFWSNSLTSLPADVFDELTALTVLFFYDNPGSAGFLPAAAAGEDQVVELGTTVTLGGSYSGGPWGDNVAYAWEQTGGVDVTLTGTNTASPSFTAPGVRDDLVFTLTVTGRGVGPGYRAYTDSDEVRVIIDGTP